MAPKKTKQEPVDQEEVSEEELRAQSIAQLYKAANKNFGKNTLVSAEESQFKKQYIPTGIAPLDYALGGGIPVGRVSLFYGHKSTSKTTNIQRIIGNAQRMCSKCWTFIETSEDGKTSCECGKKRKTVIAWLDVEGVWEDEWASNFVKLDDSIIKSQPKTAEETIDLAHAALQSQVDIIVIDSIAFMEPDAELQKSASEATVGAQARLMGNAMRKFVSTMNGLGRDTGYRPTVILTNQIRLKVGVIYGSPETQPGGLAAGFATSVEIKTSAGKYEMDESTGKPILVGNSAKVVKNKMNPPQMEAEWKVALTRGELKKAGEIIDEDWAVDMGEKAGLVSVAPQKVEWGDKVFRGKSLLEKYLMENRAAYDTFKKQLMSVILAA